jgi:hypothetical protein
MGVTRYPEPPWKLQGRGGLSFWIIPSGSVELPEGVRPLELAGRWFVGVGCIAYDESGMLAYNELVAAIAVRGTGGLGVHISHIWVDSPVSAAGGRELWGIPKKLAKFEKAGDGAPMVKADGAMIAKVEFTPRWPLPRRWKMRSRTVQMKKGQLCETSFRVDSHLAWGRARWEFGGPLAFLEGRKPLASIGLSRAKMEFGV